MLSPHFLMHVEDVIIYKNVRHLGHDSSFLYFQSITQQKQTCSHVCPSFDLFMLGWIFCYLLLSNGGSCFAVFLPLHFHNLSEFYLLPWGAHVHGSSSRGGRKSGQLYPQRCLLQHIVKMHKSRLFFSPSSSLSSSSSSSWVSHRHRSDSSQKWQAGSW